MLAQSSGVYIHDGTHDITVFRLEGTNLYVTSDDNRTITLVYPDGAHNAEAEFVDPVTGDWFVLIDATDVQAVPPASAIVTDNIAFRPLVVSSGVYDLMWDLAKSDLS